MKTTIVFRFTGGPFTYVFRELAFNNLDEIDNIQASLDGLVLAQGAQPGQVEITTGQPIKGRLLPLICLNNTCPIPLAWG